MAAASPIVADGSAQAQPAAAHGIRALEHEQIVVRRSTLEDVFLHLTGRTLVD